MRCVCVSVSVMFAHNAVEKSNAADTPSKMLGWGSERNETQAVGWHGIGWVGDYVVK